MPLITLFFIYFVKKMLESLDQLILYSYHFSSYYYYSTMTFYCAYFKQTSCELNLASYVSTHAIEVCIPFSLFSFKLLLQEKHIHFVDFLTKRESVPKTTHAVCLQNLSESLSAERFWMDLAHYGK